MALLGQSRARERERERERELTIYGTTRPRGKFAIENAMVPLGQVRESWPSMALLGHAELTKVQKLLESEIKNKNEN